MIRLATVRDLLDTVPHDHYTGSAANARRAAAGFSTDSRSLKKGEVFVALRGEQFDGHAYLADVARRGASVAVVAADWFAGHDGDTHGAAALPLIVVADTLEAYGRIATAHRSAFTIPVIAVAGSNGKTTTKELIASLLATRYNVLRTDGNLNNLIGVPATMLRLREQHTAAVIEIGTNTPGEIVRLCEILRPTHGVITNIGREHLELLGSIEGVAREEGDLFRYLASSGGTAFINLDDPHLAAMKRGSPKRVTYSMRRAADIRGHRGPLDPSGAPAMTVTNTRIERARPLALQLKTPGLHTAQNALAAAAVALSLKVPARDVKRELEAFEAKVYPGGYARLAPMIAAGGARLLNDTYNANPDSVLAALATLAAMTPEPGGMRIAVLADMKELGKHSAAEHRNIGVAVAAMKKIGLVLFHGAEMKRAWRAMRAAMKGGRAPLFYEDKDELASALAAFSCSEDVVLIKGSRGMKMEDVVKRLIEDLTLT